MVTNITEIGNYDGIIYLPTLPSTCPDKRILSVYGLDKTFTVKYIASFVHRTFHFPLEELCWIADSGAIINFPLSLTTTDKARISMCRCIKGSIYARKIDNSNFATEVLRSRINPIKNPSLSEKEI